MMEEVDKPVYNQLSVWKKLVFCAYLHGYQDLATCNEALGGS